MKEIYNNSIEFLVSDIYIPVWLLLVLASLVLITTVLLVVFANKSGRLSAELESLEAYTNLQDESIKDLAGVINKKDEVIKKKENLLRETQTKFAQYKDEVEKNKSKILDNFETKEEPKPTAKVGKSSPSRKIDSISLGNKIDSKPRTKK